MINRTKQQFYSYFEALAPRYAQYRKRFGYYWRDVTNFSNFFISADDSVLEIGCGTGDCIGKLKGKRKVAIDFSPAMIAEARKRYPEVEFQVMEAEKLQLHEKFDNIVLSNVVGYFENVADVFDSIQSVCNENTRILITYYNYVWEPLLKFAEFLHLKKRSPHQNWLSTNDIKNLLYHTGYEAYHTARRVIIPINIPGISWFFNKVLARLPLFNRLCLNQVIFARPTFHDRSNAESRYSTSVVIPARNESGNIEDAVLRLPKFGKHVEIIFVEGNSTDDTWQKIQEVQQKYSSTHDIKIARQDGRGKGDAVRKGYSIATGDILMILDADLTVPPEDIPKFYKAIATGKGEFINGSRLVYPMEKHAMRTLNTFGNMFFSRMFTWLLEQPVKDSLCGTKVMFRKDYEKLARNRSYFGDFDPFGDFDLLFGAYKLNLKIIDLPIRYQERTYGDTNISRFKHGFLLLKMCFFAAGKIKFK